VVTFRVSIEVFREREKGSSVSRRGGQ
jgi:hypothetical protein